MFSVTRSLVDSPHDQIVSDAGRIGRRMETGLARCLVKYLVVQPL